MLVSPIRMRRARLYQTLRTAHLERARALSPATILYQQTRYDFDPALTEGLDVVKAGPVAAALALLRSEVTELEVNEPLMTESLVGTVLALGALGARALAGGPRATVVTYAIENLDPFGRRRPRFRSRLRARLDAVLARYVWKRVDRIVFGTAAARDLYAAALPAAGAKAATLIPALAPACTCLPVDPASGDRAQQVVFLGDLSVRKGFPALMDAWPVLRTLQPDVELTILGKGSLEDTARAAASADGSVTTLIDPAREDIHRVLRNSRVLVLASQPTATWREQVGLPILEALSHGCAVVTTSQTGLADWLRSHGHGVVEPGASAQHLAVAIAAQLDHHPGESVLATLPSRDGRLDADRWLFRDL